MAWHLGLVILERSQIDEMVLMMVRHMAISLLPAGNKIHVLIC
jgi:hypothetical protein